MRRYSSRSLLATATAAVAAVLLIAGGLLLWGSAYVHNTVQSQLAAQQITFPPAAAFAHPKAGTEITPTMIPSVSQYAGQQLLTGQQAEAYADHFIAVHITNIAGGKTYSQLSAEAIADIQWQIERADAATLPSAHERDPDFRQALDEDDLHKVIKYYPHTKWAALAAFDLIDNKLCGDWQGSEQCPVKESELYLKYADEYPDGPRTAQALYDVVYRQAVLTDMYSADGDDHKSSDAHNQARSVAAQLKAHFPDSDYAYRAGALVYKLDEGVPVYGIDRD